MRILENYVGFDKVRLYLLDSESNVLDSKVFNYSDLIDDLKLFDDYDVYYNSNLYYVIENNIKIPLLVFKSEFSVKFDFYRYISFLSETDDNYDILFFPPFNKEYKLSEHYDIFTNKIIIEDGDDNNRYFYFEYDTINNTYSYKFYELQDNQEVFISSYFLLLLPFKFLFKYFNPIFYLSIKNIDLSSIENKIDTLNIDLTPIENKIDTVKSDITSKLDNLDFTKLKEDLKSLFSMNLTKISLNGANGSKFADGDQVVIDNFVGVWKVLSSFQAVIDDNNLTILYYVQKDDKTMIVPSAFVTQGA